MNNEAVKDIQKNFLKEYAERLIFNASTESVFAKMFREENEKAVLSQAERYEAAINPSYQAPIEPEPKIITFKLGARG